MQEPEFESVLAAAQSGAEWAWARLYHAHAGRVLGYLRVRGSTDPENLLGEVYLQVARNIATFDGSEENFRSWLFTIAHHRLLDERRTARRRPTEPVAEFEQHPADDGDATADTALAAVGTDRVRAMIAQLAPAQQEVLYLRILGGLTIPEIASAIDKNVGSVKALQRRGLEALRKMIEREGVPL
ncbi:MAG: RNA polymerase sigma factor [Acidimicrobiia bacterium]|nr:RNA polymerase sigma factor [Acidimicrobiia bacterium]